MKQIEPSRTIVVLKVLEIIDVHLAPWLLVQSEFVARGIREDGKCPGARRDVCSCHHHAAACSLNLLEGVRNVVDHDVYACLLIRSSVALLHPGPADTTGVI